MQVIFDEIKTCLENENYYAALALALTIPDALRHHQINRVKGKRMLYSEWFDEYVTPYYTYDGITLPGNEFARVVMLDGVGCYSLRCAFLHEEGFIDRNKENHLFVFHPHVHKETDYMIKDGDKDETIVWFDVAKLCRAIVRAGEQYYNNCTDKSTLKKSIIYIDTKQYGKSKGDGL